MKTFPITNIIKIVIAFNVIFFLGYIGAPPPVAASEESSVGFSWIPNSASNIAGYRIYYGTTSGGGYPNFVDIKNNVPDPKDGRIHGTVTGLTDGVTYYFVCTAYNNTGEKSDYSDEVVYTAGTTAPEIIKIQLK